MSGTDIPTVTRLRDLVGLLRTRGDEELYVRWSRGPGVDLAQTQSSKDGLTGVRLPGLSANPLRVQPWWGDRPLDLWLARRLHDYRHLRELRADDVRPWVFHGVERSRGPDNEPLVECRTPLAWVADSVIEEAQRRVDEQGSAEWGPLDRSRD
ncbi:DUF6098 family protein [Amycolatopsis suaedae]|uniref:Uncharacterized protein n=1 Tax=Amycolatopsis suaedae TaxID=2510978 RepID=A0A4V2ELR6_9PSEU|nr:DUF6098 family protein [Amycolatopsis suaedae]RZQ62495.1 hypothetical protein EWH70_19800 [Amycolatopsis suaedae]